MLPNCHCWKEFIVLSLENSMAATSGRPVIYSLAQDRATDEELYLLFKQMLLSASLKPDDARRDNPVKLVVCSIPLPPSISPLRRIGPKIKNVN